MRKLNEFYGCPVSNDGGEVSAPEDLLKVFEQLKPRLSTTPLVRIGGDSDGAYLVPDDLAGLTACFSPGVNNFKTFEDVLVDEHNIDCHMCDFTSSEDALRTPLRPGKQSFQKKWLDVDGGGDSISLDEWISNAAPKGDLILQIDIEGAEYRNLLSVSDETLERFRMIVIELHGLEFLLNASVLRDVLGPFFQRMSQFFSVVHAHPNNYSGDVVLPGSNIRVPKLLELTYLRHDRFVAKEGVPLLPHPLDVGRNVRQNAPLFLCDDWLDGDRPEASVMKMLKDKAAYADYKIPDLETRLTSLRNASIGLMQHAAKVTRKKQRKSTFESIKLLKRENEVAHGKPYSLSSAYGSLPLVGTVGRADNFFFHTGFAANEYIQIDLERRYQISKVIVENRTDACFSRAEQTFVLFSNDPHLSYDCIFKLPTSKKFLSGAEPTTSLKLPALSARYVTFISPVDTALHFADIRVFATA